MRTNAPYAAPKNKNKPRASKGKLLPISEELVEQMEVEDEPMEKPTPKQEVMSVDIGGVKRAVEEIERKIKNKGEPTKEEILKKS